MTLEELGREYLDRSDALYRQCWALERQASNRRGKASRRLRCLYADADRCRLVGLYLIHYRDTEGPFARCDPPW